jgi:hypothetical protein
MSMDAHANEYAGAVAGMNETYGRPARPDEHAVGDHISFRLHGWGDNTYDDGRVIGHHLGMLLVESATDVVEVDPARWPEGNVLPF